MPSFVVSHPYIHNKTWHFHITICIHTYFISNIEYFFFSRDQLAFIKHPQDFDINMVVNFLFEWHLGYICRLRSFTMVSCMLLSHGSQAVQTSRFSAARVPMNTCGMWYVERFWKCSL
jgi:hypothetical protein